MTTYLRLFLFYLYCNKSIHTNESTWTDSIIGKSSMLLEEIEFIAIWKSAVVLVWNTEYLINEKTNKVIFGWCLYS
jgi:Na+-transporting NADH:ubiquinone oxidoreductase subunit NqrB